MHVTGPTILVAPSFYFFIYLFGLQSYKRDNNVPYPTVKLDYCCKRAMSHQSTYVGEC